MVTTPGQTYRSTMNYPTVFHLLAEELSVRCVVIGGFAVNYHGVTRQTIDSDFMIVDTDYMQAKEVLQRYGYEEADAQEAFTRMKSSNAFLLDVDFMLVDRDTFDQVWDAGTDATVADCTFRLPSLDHLLALKFHAMKHSPNRRGGKDLMDVLALIDANEVATESATFKSLCLKFGSEQVYADIVRAVAP